MKWLFQPAELISDEYKHDATAACLDRFCSVTLSRVTLNNRLALFRARVRSRVLVINRLIGRLVVAGSASPHLDLDIRLVPVAYRHLRPRRYDPRLQFVSVRDAFISRRLARWGIDLCPGNPLQDFFADGRWAVRHRVPLLELGIDVDERLAFMLIERNVAWELYVPTGLGRTRYRHFFPRRCPCLSS